ncbi:MAG: S-layer homology domain-containing protein [Oscillospiraceae bacterium]
MRNKLLASILTVCMLLTMLPAAAFAAETEAESGTEQTATATEQSDPATEDAGNQTEADGTDAEQAAVSDAVAEVTIKGEAKTYSSLQEAMTEAAAASKTASNKVEVKLLDDVDLDGTDWTAVDVGTITIDGQGHTIRNMRISKASSGNYGAGFIWNATGTLTIKNVTFDKASVCKVYNSHNVVGIVVGYTYGTTVFDHVKVTNSGVYGFGKVGVLLGMGADPGVKVTFSNCESTGNTIYARYDAGGLAGNIQRAQKNGVAEAEANVQITGCVVDHNTFISSAPSSTEELNTKVAADDTAGDAPCVLTGKTISGPFWLDSGYYWPAYAEYYCSYGSSKHDCKLENGGNLANGEYLVGPVAEVNGVSYATLADAINAAKDGEKVNMLASTVCTENTDLTEVKSVTVDFAQHTFTGDNKNIAIRSKAEGAGVLTLMNGTITTGDGTYCTLGAANGSAIVVKDMILNNSTAFGGSVKAFPGGTIELRDSQLNSVKGGGVAAAGGTVNIYNSKIDQKEYYDWNSMIAAASNGTGVVNIYGGEFTSENYGLYIFTSGGTINVYDGTFTVTGDKPVLKADLDLGSYPNAVAEINISGGTFVGGIDMAKNENVHLNITGGTFSVDPNAYCATGYTATKNESGQWVVSPKEGMEADTSVSGNTASAEVGGTFSGNEDLGQDNVGASNGTLSIDATVTEGDTAAITKTEVSIGNEALTSVSGANSVNSVVLKTNVADLTVDKAAWNAITKNADGAKVALTIEEKAGTGGAPLTYTVTATANGKDVYSADNATGSIKISVKYEGTDLPKVYYVGPNGLEDMKAELKDGILSWTAKHFSDYVVVSGEQKILVKESDGSLEYYGTLTDAITNAGENAVITLLADIPDAVGISVPSGKKFVLDFNQHTYTLTGPGAGSPNTESNAFQLLKDSTITFKNGTIRIAEGANNIKRIIQNYADLTLENMQIYAANQVGGEDYALSFNNGNIVFKGNTSVITSNNNVIAFDVCKFSSYPGVTVTFDETYTGTINGKIVYDSPDAKAHQLIVKPNQGTLGVIESSSTSGAADAAKNGGITVSGGSFTAPVDPEYLADGLNFEAKDSNGIYTYHSKIEDALDAAGSDGTVSTTEENLGLEITLPTPTKEGYTFLYWEAKDGTQYKGGQTVKASVFQDLTAVWKKNSDSSSGSSDNERTYAIVTEDNGHGSVTVSADEASAGTRITVTVKPDAGYELDELTVTDAKNKDLKVTKRSETTYTFHMADSKVTVEASFTKDGTVQKPDTRFDDVAKSAWYYKAVEYVAENGIMSGVSAREFAPNAGFSRAMLAQTLYAMSGKPTVKAEGTFADVAANAWYADAVNWAAEKGYVSGVGDGKFAPDASITREQMALILYRYAGSPDASGMVLQEFADGDSVSAYAVDAIRWAVHEGLISGMENNTLAPQGTATRAQVAQILMNFHQKLDK